MYLGMTPSAYRSGWLQHRNQIRNRQCSARRDRGREYQKRNTVAIFFGEPASLKRDLQKQFPHARIGPCRASELQRITAKVIALVEAPVPVLIFRSTSAVPPSNIAFGGNCGHIPVGSTASYAEIAKRIGEPQSARAVARACFKPHGRSDSLPPRGQERRIAIRLSWRRAP